MGLGRGSLWEIDEAIYAEIGREMHESGDLTAPYFDYRPRFDKPPLTYWLTVLAYRTFGVNEFAARFFAALCGLAGLLLFYGLVREMMGARIALLAAFILGGCLEYPALAIMGLTDMPLTFFTILTFYGLWRAYERERPWYYLLAGLGAALATLTKGPVGLLLPGGVLFLMCLADLVARRRPWPRIFRLQFVLAVGLFLALVLPWYLAMYRRFGAPFLASNVGYHMIARFTKSLESHGQPWYYYLVLLFVALLPWSPGLLGGWRGFPRRARLLLFWGLLYLVFYSAARTKLPGYLLPVLPPAAACAARWWDKLLTAKTAGRERWVMPAVLILLGVLLGAALLRYSHRIPPGYAGLYTGLSVFACSLTGLGVALAVLLGLTRRSAFIFGACALISLAGWLGVKPMVLPALESFKPARELARAIEQDRRPGEAVISTAGEFAGLPFYLRGRVEYLPPREAGKRLAGKERVFVVTTPEDRKKIAPLAPRAIVRQTVGRGILLANRPD